MLKEVLNYFNIVNSNNNILAIDCTLGQGGHSYEIFKILNSGVLISLDKDIGSINWVKKFYGLVEDIYVEKNKKWILVNDDFANLDQIIKNFGNTFDFLIADLGISNYQLRRNIGFSYSNDYQILDMRITRNDPLIKPAYEYLNTLTANDLKTILVKFGHVSEKIATRISEKILRYRKTQFFYRVIDLKNILKEFGKGIVVKVFQALRIFVNREDEKLKVLLNFVKQRQSSNGISLIITFNPLEEEIINQNLGTHLIIDPNINEIIENVQSRTAKLHVYKI